MKILVLADIHSNWPALAAIEESFDACLFVGDLVDYATDPIPCIDWIRARAAAAIRGNHDHAVAQRIPARDGSGFRGLAAATRPIHWKVLNPTRIKYLSRLPVTRQITLDGKSFYLVHGTPRDPLDEYLTNDSELWNTRLESIEADFVCVGHTHIPFHLNLGHVQVINPGSVGQPRDGDPRSAYAVIDNGVVSFRRIPYDIDATLRQMRETGVNGDALALAESVLRTGGRA
jgi:putative phosphoesterase